MTRRTTTFMTLFGIDFRRPEVDCCAALDMHSSIMHIVTTSYYLAAAGDCALLYKR